MTGIKRWNSNSRGNYALFECLNGHYFVADRDFMYTDMCIRCQNWKHRHDGIQDVPLHEMPCRHCLRWPSDHVGDQCLFAPTLWDPLTEAEVHDAFKAAQQS